MNDAAFWTVFKADLLFSLCSFTVGIAITIALRAWSKRRKAASVRQAEFQGPRVVVIGGREPRPHSCPLCGRDWTYSGPELH